MAAHCYARQITKVIVHGTRKRRAQVQICALLSFLDARPEGVAPKGRSGESRGDRKPCLVSCPLLSLPGDPGIPGRRRRQCTRHVMANILRPGRASLASSGKPLYRRYHLPSAEGEERRALVASDGENQAFFVCLRSTADFTISMPIRHTTPISTMVPPGFSPP